MAEVLAVVLAMLFGGVLFAGGIAVGWRMAKDLPPVPVPKLNPPPPSERKEPEEQGWATREKPHVDEVV